MIPLHLRHASAGALLLAAFGLAGPAAAQENVAPAPLDPAVADEAPPSASEPVATVNGDTVTLDELVEARSRLPAQYQQLPDQALYDALREQAVTETLLAQAAEAAALAEDPDVARALERRRKTLLAEAFMRQAVEARVTEEAIEAAYQERYVEAEPVREIRARHILVPEEAVAEALKIRLEEGADFAELAAEAGTDGTAQQGGDLGFFGREQMVPEFAEAAFSAELGEVVGPVQTQFGWHLIEVTEERVRPVPPLEAVSGQLAAELAGEAAQEIVAELREGAAVEVEEGRPGVAGLRDDTLIAFP